MAEHWSRLEVEAVVADYLDMLASELRGENYSKAEHRRVLASQLIDRSKGSIEYKHQNISAILREERVPWIEGYKPAGNYQRLLRDVLEDRLLDPSLHWLLDRSVSAPVDHGAVIPSLEALVDPPPAADVTYEVRQHVPRILKVDYLELEARNRSLGLAGENWVVEFERGVLSDAGMTDLALEVEHVSVARGDGLGYDVRSFDIEGRERFIEVKTTAYGKQTPFYISRGELAFARTVPDRYLLYRLFRFRESPRLYRVGGPLEGHFRLEPAQFVATPGDSRRES